MKSAKVNGEIDFIETEGLSWLIGVHKSTIDTGASNVVTVSRHVCECGKRRLFGGYRENLVRDTNTRTLILYLDAFLSVDEIMRGHERLAAKRKAWREGARSWGFPLWCGRFSVVIMCKWAN